MTERSRCALGAAAVGLVSLGVYLLTLAPGLTWAHDSADGGELAAAAHTLGIPHPPGYPTYLLLAHPFTRLPIGEVATRTNLFSAVCAAGTAALVTWTVARMRGSRAGAIGAGLALAFSPLLWSQATVTEVYTLSALFTALLLALGTLSEPRACRPPWRVALIGVAVGGVWGLGIGSHPTALFSGPLAVFALWRLRRLGLAGLAGIALGLAVYAYLPLRAAADPPINWGNPRTLRQLWWLISGAPYQHYVLALPRAHLPTRLLAWTGLMMKQFSAPGLVVAALGATSLWTANRPLLLASAATAALHIVFAIGYNTSDSYLYLIPALVCLGLWLGAGLDWLIEVAATRGRRAGRLAVAVTAIAPLAGVVFRFPVMNLSDDRATEEFRIAVLASAPPLAVILSQQDAHTFALWYFQHAEGNRPDVIVVDTGLLGYGWHDTRLAQQLGPPQPFSSSVDMLLAEGYEGLLQAAEALNRPVCRIDSGGTRLSCAEP